MPMEKKQTHKAPMTKERLCSYIGIQLRVQRREERLMRMRSNAKMPAGKE